MTEHPGTDIAVVLVDEVIDSAFALVWEVLSAAVGHAGHGPTPRLLRVAPSTASLRSSARNTLWVDGDLNAAQRCGYVVVPAFAAGDGSAIERRLQSEEGRLLTHWLHARQGVGVVVAAGGPAVFLLGESGLLDGKRCTTNPPLREALRRRYPRAIVDATSVVTGSSGVYCCGPLLGHISLALSLARHCVCDEALQELARTVWSGRDHEVPTVSDEARRPNREAARAEVWIRENLARRFRIAEVARAVGVSPRTLARRISDAAGVSPREFVQLIRMRHARLLLETTAMTVEEVSAAVGHRDPTQLRRIFRKLVGQTPSQHRRTHEASA